MQAIVAHGSSPTGLLISLPMLGYRRGDAFLLSRAANLRAAWRDVHPVRMLRKPSGSIPAIRTSRAIVDGDALADLEQVQRHRRAGDNTECLTDRIPREQSHVIAMREEAFE